MMNRRAVMMIAVILTGTMLQSEAAVKYQNVNCVIVAGGDGNRLWPLSRADRPKQFLTLGAEETLLEQAITRAEQLLPKENIWISTTARHEKKVREFSQGRVGHVVVEPGSRNTGPAFLLSCFTIAEYDPEAIVFFVYADAYIPDTNRFNAYVEHALEYCGNHDTITLLGLKPTYPATGYGYIEFDTRGVEYAPYPVKKFHEKPILEKAEQYVTMPTMLWNIGMFCGKVSSFMNEFSVHAPDIFAGVKSFIEGKSSYQAIRSESIDYAVMEKSSNITVLPADFSWCDVGNVAVFLSIKEQSGSLNKNIYSFDAHNNLVDVQNRLVALVGVDELCVVESYGMLLITRRDRAEQVKEIVNQLKQSGIKECL